MLVSPLCVALLLERGVDHTSHGKRFCVRWIPTRSVIYRCFCRYEFPASCVGRQCCSHGVPEVAGAEVSRIPCLTRGQNYHHHRTPVLAICCGHATVSPCQRFSREGSVSEITSCLANDGLLLPCLPASTATAGQCSRSPAAGQFNECGVEGITAHAVLAACARRRPI